jgi:Ribosomal protein S3, C-terminal domain.
LVSRKRFNRFDADEKVYKRNIVVEVLKTVFINRWIFLIKNYLQIALARFTYSYSKLPVEVMFVCVSNNNISANFVTKYLSTRLLQKFPIRRLMSSLLKQLKLAQQNGSIHGFKVVCNGRFARRGRASHV